MAGERHGRGMLCVNRPLTVLVTKPNENRILQYPPNHCSSSCLYLIHTAKYPLPVQHSVLPLFEIYEFEIIFPLISYLYQGFARNTKELVYMDRILAAAHHGITSSIILTHKNKNATYEIYEGNSISKLQIVIEKNRMEIMTYKQHLFFNIISIQI